MAENLHDSRRENELITGHRILTDIYKGEYGVIVRQGIIKVDHEALYWSYSETRDKEKMSSPY